MAIASGLVYMSVSSKTEDMRIAYNALTQLFQVGYIYLGPDQSIGVMVILLKKRTCPDNR